MSEEGKRKDRLVYRDLFAIPEQIEMSVTPADESESIPLFFKLVSHLVNEDTALQYLAGAAFLVSAGCEGVGSHRNLGTQRSCISRMDHCYGIGGQRWGGR